MRVRWRLMRERYCERADKNLRHARNRANAPATNGLEGDFVAAINVEFASRNHWSGWSAGRLIFAGKIQQQKKNLLAFVAFILKNF